MDQVLQQLIEYMKEVSPMLWETLLRQVYLNAVTNSIWATAWLVVGIIGLKVTFYYRHMMQESNSLWHSYDIGVMLGILTTVVGFSLLLVCFSFALSMFLNPQYYAIQLILQNLK